MQTKFWTAGAMIFVLSAGLLRAEEWVKESFEGEVATSVQEQGGTRKVQWLVKEEGALRVVDDSAGLASGKALQSRQILGVIPPVILADPGDSVTVQFDFRLTAPLQNGAGYSPRFGLYYADSADAKDPWLLNNGAGYYAGLNATAVAGGVVLGKEAGTGGILDGNDMTQLAKSSKELWVNDDKKHTAVMTITALPEGGLKISLQLDGVAMVDYSDLLASGDLTLNRFALLGAPNTVLFDNFKVDLKMSGSSQSSP